MSQALFLDFDDTLTIRTTVKPSIEIFGDEKRIKKLKKFLNKCKSKGVDLYILSHNNIDIVDDSLKLIDRENLYKFEIIAKKKYQEKPDKAKYINKWKKKYDTLVFVDNDKTQYEGINPSVITIEINEEGGLTKPDMEKIDSYFEKKEEEEDSLENAPFSTPQKRSPATPRTPSSRNTKTPKSAGVDYKMFDLF